MGQESDVSALRKRVEKLEQELETRSEQEPHLRSEANRYRRLLETIPCALYDYVLWPDGASRFIYMSPNSVEIFEHSAERIMAEPELLWSMVHPEDVGRLHNEDSWANRNKSLFISEVRITIPSGGVKWIELTSKPSAEHYQGQTIWSGVVLDITQRKQAEEERDRVIGELRAALGEVKRLSGLLPICAWCKKIRDDQGYWNQIESYISGHSEAQFSHGICPECAAGLTSRLKDRKPD